MSRTNWLGQELHCPGRDEKGSILYEPPRRHHVWSKSYRHLNSGIYTGRAIGRNGKLCENCGHIEWDETDAEWIARLCESSPSTIIYARHVPPKYQQHIPAELWEKRLRHKAEEHREKLLGLLRHHQKETDRIMKELLTDPEWVDSLNTH
jgi:hypothetical protein